MIRRFLVWAGILVFVAGWLLVFCRSESEPQTPDASQDPIPVQEGWNSKIILSTAGTPRAVVHYGHMFKYDKQPIVFFDEGVEVDFYNENGERSSHLRSERGEYHETTEDVLGIGRVTVESDSGITLKTERLRLDNSRSKIFSDTTVMITTAELDTLYGIGFESRTDLTRWKILKPWGVSEKRVDIEKIEADLSEPVKEDTAANGEIEQ